MLLGHADFSGIMDNYRYILNIFLLCGLISTVTAQWGYSQEEMEVWDLADEFKGNFYEFLEISQDASTSDIRRAYRKLSLTMHPDKNKTEGAEENFRTLAAIYEVLKNKEKREIYDNVLVNGIPSAYLYVPKPLRKMSLTEVSIIVSLILTCGHYITLWGLYAEKRLTLEQYMPKLEKKKQKARKKGDFQSAEVIDNISDQIQKPRLSDILPIAIFRGIYFLVKFTPGYIQQKRREAEELKEMERIRKEEEEQAEEERVREQARREEQKTLRKQRAKEKREEMLQYVETTVKDGGNFYSPFESDTTIEELEDMYDSSDDDKRRKQKNKKWTVDDESSLIKLMSKYPVGSSQRWHVIADEMEKEVIDVINHAKKMKGNMGAENTSTRQKVKGSNKVNPDAFNEMATVRHHGLEENTGDDSVDSEIWDSSQQKLFEMALRQFPKGTPARWDKIAKCVPTKTKEDCIARYKELAEMVQQKQNR